MPYLLFLKKLQNFKLPSAANYRWRFMQTIKHLLKLKKDKMGRTARKSVFWVSDIAVFKPACSATETS